MTDTPPPTPSTTSTTPAPATTDAKPDTLMCVLSYLGIFALIPFLARKNDPFLQWHSRQGLGLTVVAFVVAIVLGILGSLFLPSLFGILNGLLGLAFLALAIVGILKALKGERWLMPVVGPIVNKT